MKTHHLIRNAAILLILFMASMWSAAQDDAIRVHDPVMVRQGERYYLFCTGFGISVYSSADMEVWEREPRVFDEPPAWAVEQVPGFRGHIWAPDISLKNDTFYLYYSVSTFGSNLSCIGLATNQTLDPRDPGYRWVDHGPVVGSVPGRDMWNAIDPNLVVDDSGTPWLTFGSFWKGIKLFRLNESLDAPSQPPEWHTIASRPRDIYTDEKEAGEGAIEAPFIFRKGKLYYLFVSFDYCCRGIESTYKMMVGRSETITGPYQDKDGRDMILGGGTLLLEGNKDWPGVGHNAVYTFDGEDYLIYHGYDAGDHGRSKLRINKLHWDDQGWPVVQND